MKILKVIKRVIRSHNEDKDEDFGSDQTEYSLHADTIVTDSESFRSCYSISKHTLGEGGFSTVRAGTNRKTLAPVAIKIVKKSELLEQEEEALKREVSLLQIVSHPNITQFKDYFEGTGHYFIIQERMFRGDLLSRIAGHGFLPESEAQEITKGIAEALSYLHSKMIVHRDVKPENILIANDSSSKTVVAKLSDFGLAKQLSPPDVCRRHTLCGTVSYASPEVLSSQPYDFKTDVWSLGVVTYTMIAGYQPFRIQEGEVDEEGLKERIVTAYSTSSLVFEEKFWDDISDSCTEFIANLTRPDTDSRLSSDEALTHKWLLQESSNLKNKNSEDQHQVFFMIGSQRSGSNWLRTMLDEREDLPGPHPPHMMRDFMPMIDKFGDLGEYEKFRVLVDHLCTFVEKNQVPWTDRHNQRISFVRRKVFSKAIASCQRLLNKQNKEKEQETKAKTPSSQIRLEKKGLYLLSIFDSIMEFYTKSNGKRTWICKSMGMSKFHDLLIDFYGESRLRYIYLVRDPRDVAMSFMKTPVGDCHYHAITSKWVGLQKCALKIVEEHPQLVHQLHYEQILKEKLQVMSKLYEFIGERQFSEVKRQASVLCFKPVDECLRSSRKGRQSLIAKNLSYQFQNLYRGDSFLSAQYQKWADPITGLKDEEILMIESVAGDVMKTLGYETHLVEKGNPMAIYTKDDVLRFAEENELAIQHMKNTLKTENPDDFERRRIQAEVLTLDPVRLNDWENDDDNEQVVLLSEEELDIGLVVRQTETYKDLKGRSIQWATASQQGYSPMNALHTNQDYAVSQSLVGNEAVHFFSVLDGHGEHGHRCSAFAGEHIREQLENVAPQELIQALHESHVATHKKVVNETDIDCTRSGTTAASVIFLSFNKILVSNLGDSSVIVGSKPSNGLSPVAKKIVPEHSLFNAEELERVGRADGIVMSMEEKQGLDCAESDRSPPRIWHADPEKSPGVAFTRSIGDTIAHGVGVIAHPEVVEYSLRSKDDFLLLCSDGVTEWMDEKTCIDLVSKCKDPSEASTALVKEARTRWMQNSDYIDDVTAIVIFLGGEEQKISKKKKPISSSSRIRSIMKKLKKIRGTTKVF